MKRQEDSYTPADHSRALEAYVRLGSYAEAALETDIPEKTVETWAKHPKHSGTIAEIRVAHAQAQSLYRVGLAKRAWDLVSKAVGALENIVEAGEPDEVTSASRAAADIARTLDSAARLDANMPTSISGSADTETDEQVITRLERILNLRETRALVDKHMAKQGG